VHPAGQAELFAGGDFAFDVQLRGGIFADENGGETGADALRVELGDSDFSSEKISSRIFRPSRLRAGIGYSLSLCFEVQMIAREEKQRSNEPTSNAATNQWGQGFRGCPAILEQSWYALVSAQD